MTLQSSDVILARLRVLVWIAQADGEIQPWEKTVLNRMLQTILAADDSSEQRHEPITVDRWLQEPFSIAQALSTIQSPHDRRDTYEEAVAIAQLDGITPAEERCLAHLRAVFHLSDESAASSEPVVQVGAAPPGDARAAVVQAAGLDAEVVWANPMVSGRGIVLGMRRLINHSRQVRSLIFDYAIGAAIIGLIPFPQLLLFKLLSAAVLIFKMLRDIGSQWGFPKGADPFAVVGNLFGFIGALAIAFMAWLTVFGLGLVYPSLRALSLAAAFSTFTWAVGQVTNQYYMSSSRLDVTALRRVMQYQSSSPSRPRWLQWLLPLNSKS